jgi:hypothetical protein
LDFAGSLFFCFVLLFSVALFFPLFFAARSHGQESGGRRKVLGPRAAAAAASAGAEGLRAEGLAAAHAPPLPLP